MNAATWKPVLSGEDADRALAVARELGALVRDAPPAGDPGLATGEAGRAVALAYLENALPGEGFGSAADEALRAAARAVATGRVGPALMHGFTGVAWATVHLARREGESADEATAAIDGALVRLLEQGGWRSGFDLVSGVCGVGVYALEKPASPTRTRLLELTTAELSRLATRTSGGVTWLSHPEHLHPETAARSPHGFFDAGLAHGAPGPVGVLAGAQAAGIEEAGALLDGAVEWLAAIALPDDAASLLPYGVGEGVNPAPARLAWCYGDPGAAAALLIAARTGHAPAKALADRALARIAARGDDTASVQGASLCHGTAGIAHILGRLDSLTGTDRLAPVARRWIDATHELRDAARGPGGFSEWDPADSSRPPADVQGLDLVGGLAGVALALTAAATGADPAWDRLLLISPAPEPVP